MCFILKANLNLELAHFQGLLATLSDSVVLISGGLSLQWLETGLEFPARDWTGSWRWKDQILAIRPVVKDKGSGPSALKKIISTKMESSEASKMFIKRKKYSRCG